MDMYKNLSLSEKLEDVFEKILKGHITNKMIAEVFSSLKLKGYNYTDIKNALLSAGDLEPSIKTDVYSRDQIKKIFNWEERALQENLKKWKLPHSSKNKLYKKEAIKAAAENAGWSYHDGAWWKPRPKRKD